MIPVYVAYFTGDSELGTDNKRTDRALFNSLFFILGFTLIFMLLGIFAGAIGSLLSEHRKLLNILSGALIIFFGLTYMGLIPINVFKGATGKHVSSGFLSSFLFGIIFSISLTPCVGAFLGSALALASSRASVFEGAALLLVYSLGLGLRSLSAQPCCQS